MKKLAIALLSSILLFGCSQNETVSVPVSETTENAEITEVSTEPQTTKKSEITKVSTETKTTESVKITEVTTKTVTSQPKPRKKDNLSVICKTDSVKVQINGEDIQTIELDYTPTSKDIIKKDFNYDGEKDIFICEENNKYYGTYRLYEPENNSFRKADEFAVDDGRAPLFEIGAYGRLKYSTGGWITTRHYEYLWENASLNLVGLTEEFDNGLRCVKETYEFDDDGNKVMKLRLRYSNGELVDREESPRYFVVDGENVFVMREGQLVDTLPSHDLCEKIDARRGRDCPDLVIYPPEHYISCEDYNNDGFMDAAVPYEFNEYTSVESYDYYRFDPETNKYVQWDELNRIGAPLLKAEYDSRLGVQCDLYRREKQKFYTDDYNEYFYFWHGDKLATYARILHYDIVLNEIHKYDHKEALYKYDANGNEYYSEELPVPDDGSP